VQSDEQFLTFDSYELRRWLLEQEVQREIQRVLIHHTWSPNYTHFNGSNHLALQAGMRRYHMVDRGWDDIGQHFSTFPDGKILTGRPLELTPACTKGANVNAVCIENVGNFDLGGDEMTDVHRETILETTAWICERWNIPVNSDHVVYHHWFDLNTGLRTDGTGVTKTCPGTNFFLGNAVEDAEAHFMPQVYLKIESARRP
jgi:hypothetical protein